MKNLFCKLTAFFLVFSLLLTPGMVQTAFTQDAPAPAAKEELQTLKRLAKNGYLGDKKDFYLSAPSLSQDQVIDALVVISESISKVNPKDLKPGDSSYDLEDLSILLKLTTKKSEALVARKVSAWKMRNQIRKIIAAVTPPAEEGEATVEADAEKVAAPKATPVPTAIPYDGPSRAEWGQMRDDLKDLNTKMTELQGIYEKKADAIQKSNEDVKKSGAENQEQLALLKKLLDHVQNDLKKLDDRLDQVDKKASEKSLTDTELQQDLTVLRKDLRDNSQDVSLLKEHIAKMDKTDSQKGQNGLDEALGSKWLAGGALLVGIAALVVGLTNK
jgi:hypothetical protein